MCDSLVRKETKSKSKIKENQTPKSAKPLRYLPEILRAFLSATVPYFDYLVQQQHGWRLASRPSLDQLSNEV